MLVSGLITNVDHIHASLLWLYVLVLYHRLVIFNVYKVFVSCAFYGLQSAGLCTNGVTPDAAADMIKVAIQLVLVYGCATIIINPGAMKTLEKTQ